MLYRGDVHLATLLIAEIKQPDIDAATAKAGGVDQAHAPAGRIAPFMRDGVARQARLGTGDHAFLAEKCVDQRRLADIRSADNGDT